VERLLFITEVRILFLIKKSNFIKYQNAIEKIDALTIANVPKYANNNYWMYALQINKNYPLDREGVMKKLSEHKIKTRPIWHPNHLLNVKIIKLQTL